MLSGRRPDSFPGDQLGDIVSALFKQCRGLRAHQHSAFVVPHQGRRCFGFAIGQALALSLEVQGFEFDRALNREMATGRASQGLVIQ